MHGRKLHLFEVTLILISHLIGIIVKSYSAQVEKHSQR